MNLFRGEEHARRWAQFEPASDPVGFIALPDLVALFNYESRRHFRDPDFISRWLPQWGQERAAVLQRIGKTMPYWTGTS